MDRVLYGAAFLAAITLAFLAMRAFGGEHTKDTPAEVKKAMQEGKAVLIDVREAGEWKDGHIQDAKHLLLSDLKAGVPPEKLKTLIPPGKIVYLHCAAGRRSLMAADLLKAAGFESRPLKPGYSELIEAGLPKSK